MTVKRTKPVSLEELWAYEDQHPVVFASPRALIEARLIAGMDRPKQIRHRPHKNGASHSRRRKTVAH
jgi:hypothetical protein